MTNGDSQSGTICVACCNSGFANNEANARLIAAAPDLLAACELLLAVYAPLYRPTECVDAFSSAVISARAAIAKAEGR